jgi:hypothetical protein
MTGKKKVNDFKDINRVMNFRPNYGMSKLVCITNGKEVLRITRKKTEEYFFKKVKADKKELEIKKELGCRVDFEKGFYLDDTKGWYYTTKKVYKQYIESLKPNSNTPPPKFQYKNKKNSIKPKNIFL